MPARNRVAEFFGEARLNMGAAGVAGDAWLPLQPREAGEAEELWLRGAALGKVGLAWAYATDEQTALRLAAEDRGFF